MIKSYLRIAIRNIFRNKLFSTVNIMGLAFGIASALLIFLWIGNEMQVDQYHERIDRIYRVMENQRYTDGNIFTFASTPAPMAPFIKEKFPEIEKASRFTWSESNLFQYGDHFFYEEGRFVDADLLDIFSIDFIAGDKATALKDKNSIVISEKMAIKYFGKEEAVGKALVMGRKNNFTVTAVFKDLSPRSSIQFDYLIPFQYFWDENSSWLESWGNNNIRTYLLLKEGADAAAFADKLKFEIKEHEKDSNTELFIQPYGDVYLHGNFENGLLAGGRIEYVRIFFIVAIFVLLIACINFMNLSTAQASKRAKEVGLRKVIGAVPRQLFNQFMGESFLTVLFSAGIAVVLTFLLLPLFNEVTGKSMRFSLLDGQVLGVLVAVIVITSFIAGSYPAIFISEFKPVQVLKGQLKSGKGAGVFRKSLVVVQFSLSIILIISTMVVFRQMNFMQNQDIGFERKDVFSLGMEGEVAPNFETFRNRLLAQPGVESVTMSTQSPISIGNSTIGVTWEGKNPDEKILFTTLDVDYEFIQSMKMQMVEGRTFDRSVVNDTSNYIVNQKAAAKFGFKGEVAGQDLTMWERKGKIVGVVKDFNFGSLHSEIEPLIMRLPQKLSYGTLLVRSKPNESAIALKSTETLWKEYATGYPFKYSFLDQDWDEFYKAEGQRGKVFNILAVLSIFISCLGLFGLSAFSAERKTKELGVRKVLGASVPGLVQLMGKEFTILVLIAGIIGCPIGWYIMNEWLMDYAFHVNVGWVTLLIATAACLSLSLITVAYHSIKVSLVNPAKSLKYE